MFRGYKKDGVGGFLLNMGIVIIPFWFSLFDILLMEPPIIENFLAYDQITFSSHLGAGARVAKGRMGIPFSA